MWAQLNPKKTTWPIWNFSSVHLTQVFLRLVDCGKSQLICIILIYFNYFPAPKPFLLCWVFLKKIWILPGAPEKEENEEREEKSFRVQRAAFIGDWLGIQQIRTRLSIVTKVSKTFTRFVHLIFVPPSGECIAHKGWVVVCRKNPFVRLFHTPWWWKPQGLARGAPFR